MSLPAIFLSHGAPDLLLSANPTRTFLQHLGQRFPHPAAVLVVSAHWATRIPTVTTAQTHGIQHDFRGFPEALYQMTYQAPGAIDLAQTVQQDLQAAGLGCETDPHWKLDHGAWEPLLLMYPEGNVPVVQLSIQPRLSPQHHYAMGQHLANLRRSNVLILASGGMTHNLRQLRSNAPENTAEDWVVEFDRWMGEAIVQGDISALLNYRDRAPYAEKNHPTDEHLLPLFVALGAGASSGRRLHQGFTYGVLSMAAYEFGD